MFYTYQSICEVSQQKINSRMNSTQSNCSFIHSPPSCFSSPSASVLAQPVFIVPFFQKIVEILQVSFTHKRRFEPLLQPHPPISGLPITIQHELCVHAQQLSLPDHNFLSNFHEKKQNFQHYRRRYRQYSNLLFMPILPSYLFIT